MSEAEKTTTTCPACGYPVFAGHASNCPSASKEGEHSSGFIVEEALGDEDRRKFFELFYKVYQSEIGEDEAPIKRRVELSLKYFDRPASPLGAGAERHVYVIRDKEDIVTGGELFIGQKEGRKEAYFGHKIVDEKYRGQELARLLVEKRLEVARAAGCKEAWSIIEGDNVPALRSIIKDGFVIKGNGMTKTGDEIVRDKYYVSLDLVTPTESHPMPQLDTISHVRAADQLQGDDVLIALEDRALIEQAFDAGYLGIQIALPKDSKQIDKAMMLLEKSK